MEKQRTHKDPIHFWKGPKDMMDYMEWSALGKPTKQEWYDIKNNIRRETHGRKDSAAKKI